MRRAAVLALLLAAAGAQPASADAGITGRLLVSLERPAAGDGPRARAAASAVTARAAARRDGPAVPQIGLVTVRPGPGGSLAATARRLRSDPRVRAVSVERRAQPRLVPNDPALTDPETASGTPPGTTVQWWAQRLGLLEAWDVVRGTAATVAIVDSGIDGGHPELAGKVRAALDADPTVGAGGPLSDETGHGTHVASLACAAGDNATGLAGAGLDCGVVVAKTDFGDASVASAIVQAADLGVEAMSLAFGTDGQRPPPPAITDAIAYAQARDVVLVAAAADASVEEQGDPANVLQPTGTGPDLESNGGLSVTASTFSDARAWFAGRGTQISLAAPGAFERGSGPRGLFGAWPANPTSFDRGGAQGPPCRCRRPYRGDLRYADVQGTSMATGIVTGIAGLVRELNPDLRAPEVVRLLKSTARQPAGSGWTPELGWGVVDARAAVESARLMDRRPPASRLRAPRRVRAGALRLRFRGRDKAPPGVVASGLARFEIWRAAGRRRARKIASTRRRAYRVRTRAGRRYRFFTVAVDRAGNREPLPSRPDATVRAVG